MRAIARLGRPAGRASRSSPRGADSTSLTPCGYTYGYVCELNSTCDENCQAGGCGDGITAWGELCDAGAANLSGEGTCNGTCDGFQVCDDGTVEGTEACEGEGCKPSCLALEVCGAAASARSSTATRARMVGAC